LSRHTEQSRRKLPSSRAATRAQDAALEVGSLRPALPQHARCCTQHLQPSTFNLQPSTFGSSEPKRLQSGKMPSQRH
jgi:hypothetical protein